MEHRNLIRQDTPTQEPVFCVTKNRSRRLHYAAVIDDKLIRLIRLVGQVAVDPINGVMLPIRRRLVDVQQELQVTVLIDFDIRHLRTSGRQPRCQVIEISSPSADAVQYKDRLLTWSEKYQITDAQIDTEQNAASNAECIEAIFNRYVRSTEQTIFMSRCFSAEYNETENAIRRAINEINNEKKTGIMLIRVDEHHEGTTGQISDRIFRDIESAGLVIADLSSGKLNVPHEIGYAMGLKKDLILVHNGTSEEAEKHIPSNIRMFEQIRFNGDYQTLQNEIKRRLIDYYKL